MKHLWAFIALSMYRSWFKFVQVCMDVLQWRWKRKTYTQLIEESKPVAFYRLGGGGHDE